jgi:hypothetical protein
LGSAIELVDRQTLLAVFTVIYVLTAAWFLFQAQQRLTKRKNEQKEIVSKGLLSGAIESVEDMVNVYKGINGLGGDDISYQASIGRFLREYLAKLAASDDLSAEQIKDLKGKVNEFLKKIDETAPFAELPAAERNLMVDIQRFINARDQASAFRKLEDLAGLIAVKQDEFETLRQLNRWLIPIAVIGLTLTVIFGIA